MNDWFKRTREDFFIWRNLPNHRLAVNLAFTGIGVLVLGFITIRLWRTRLKKQVFPETGYFEGDSVRTPLHELGLKALGILGSRSSGQPFVAWLSGLRDHLELVEQFDEAAALHQRMRYDPNPLSDSDAMRLTELAHNLSSGISESGRNLKSHL